MDEIVAGDEISGEDAEMQSEEQMRQIERIRELRSQKRKMEGNDYIPFDESTSEGKYAQISNMGNIDSIEAQMLKKQLIRE